MTNESYPVVRLKPGRDFAIKKGHPWVFSGALADGARTLSGPVRLVSDEGEPVAVGLASNEGSIKVKVLALGSATLDAAFWEEKIARAWALREMLGLASSDTTTAFRAVNAEGDGIPGLVVDFYAGTAVMVCQLAALDPFLPEIGKALRVVIGERLKAIYVKRPETNKESSSCYLLGEQAEGEVFENGYRFLIDWQRGQKTGFFLDQRENRRLVGEYSRGRRVLNAFCYTGGFSVYALGGGATHVHSVDTSKPALEMLDANMRLNFERPAHEATAADFFRFMQEMPRDFDLIVLDPPAFAKDRKAVPSALKGYKNINLAAFRALPPGGLLFTFSCSQLVLPDDFRNAVLEAAASAGRLARIIHRLHQAPCHPVRLSHPEGEYLKGLVIQVD